MDGRDETVVVPLVPLPRRELSTEDLLRLLVNRDAVLVKRVVQRSSTGGHSGLVAPASGAVAKAFGQVVGRMTALPPGGLYRVVLPSGSVVRDLVPAVGGGFRGLVRGAGSAKITGHARLIPAATGAGATLAAGPLLATVGLAVAGEMLAQHQINKKLDSISAVVSGIQRRMEEQERSVLVTAAQQASKVAGYLLDQAELPPFSSAGHAFGELDSLTNVYVERLDRWLDVVEQQPTSGTVHAATLLDSLVGKQDDPIAEFEHAVSQTYEALALRARVVVLEKVAAGHSNRDRPLPHVENLLREELSMLATKQAQLIRVVEDLSAMQIDSIKTPIGLIRRGVPTIRTSLGRLSRALHSAPDGLPILTEADQTVIELAPTADGLAVIKPIGDQARSFSSQIP